MVSCRALYFSQVNAQFRGGTSEFNAAVLCCDEWRRPTVFTRYVKHLSTVFTISNISPQQKKHFTQFLFEKSDSSFRPHLYVPNYTLEFRMWCLWEIAQAIVLKGGCEIHLGAAGGGASRPDPVRY